MLTYVGETTNDIFDTLPSTGTDYDSAVLPAQSLTERFDPAVNMDMEICEFRQITQSSGETLNEFYRRLKEKASTCEFANEEAEIRTQIIHKTSDAHLRRKALRDEPDLKALLQCGLTLEQSDRHSKLLEEDKNTPYRQINFIKGTIATVATATVATATVATATVATATVATAAATAAATSGDEDKNLNIARSGGHQNKIQVTN